jgi:hypothetical protein
MHSTRPKLAQHKPSSLPRIVNLSGASRGFMREAQSKDLLAANVTAIAKGSLPQSNAGCPVHDGSIVMSGNAQCLSPPLQRRQQHTARL